MCSKILWAAAGHDPLYKSRGLLRHGIEHLTERQQAKSVNSSTPATRPRKLILPGSATNSCAPSTTQYRPKGRQIAIKVLDSFHSCPIPEVARLGRSLRAWKAQILAYFDTHGSSGGTEAINLQVCIRAIDAQARAGPKLCHAAIPEAPQATW